MNTMIKRLIVLLSIFGISFNYLHADEENDVLPNNIPTPNAATIEAVTEIPMTFYHGKAGISVPLYNTSQRGVPFDMMLYYDTSGILVNNLPSWTGHSWTLDAGGVITRITKYYQDEYDEYAKASEYNPSAWKNYFHSYATGPTSSFAGDLEPDIFTFNFMGHTGKFFLGNDGQWKVSSNENISVVFDINDEENLIQPSIKRPSVGDGRINQYKTIKGFTLVDGNGTRYVFGYNGNDNAIEYSMDLRYSNDGTMAGFWYADSWYLSSVYDRFGNKLYGFSYDRGRFLVNSSSASRHALPALSLNLPSYLMTITMRDGTTVELTRDTINTLTSTDFYHSMCLNNRNIRTYLLSYYCYGSNISNSFVYLERSDYAKYQNPDKSSNDPLSAMEFTPLKEIKIKDRSGCVFKRYTFNYGHTKGVRLHIDNIAIDDGKNTSLGSYCFNYYKFGSLPVDKEGYSDYLTSSIDNWGFYNGRSYYQGETSSNANPVEETTKYGMLTSIHYPTGGMDSICYRLNSYEKYRNDRNQIVSADKTCSCGGLAVSRILTYEGIATNNNLARERNFYYYDGQLTCESSFIYSGNIENGRFSNASSLTRKFGYHVGYSKVIEEIVDGLSQNKIRNEYVYSNLDGFKNTSCWPDWNSWDLYDNGWADAQYRQAIYDEWTDRSYKRGLLLSQTTVTDDNYTWKQTEYEYDFEDVEDYSVECYMNRSRAIGFSTINPEPLPYELFYGKYGISHIDEYERHGTQLYSKTIEYSDQSRNIKDSKGNYSHIRYRTNETITDGANYSRKAFCYTFDNQTMVDEFFLPVTDTKFYRNSVFVKGCRDEYRLQDGKPVLSAKKEYFTSDMSDAIDILTCQEYSPTFMLTKYKNKMGLTIQDEYNKYDQIISTKKGDMKYSYQYDSHGRLQTIENPNELKTSYAYDTFNRLSNVKIDNDVTKEYKYNYSTSVGQSSSK